MPFTIRSLALPFVKVSTTAKTGRTMIWHAGPWKYNTRTGQHSIRLGKKVSWDSRTRTQKAAAAKRKAVTRAAEKEGWDSYFAGEATAPGTTAKKATPARPATKKTTSGRRPGTARPPASTSHPGKVRPARAVPQQSPSPEGTASGGQRVPLSKRQEKARAAGLCGALTRDGSPCMNTGQCPHHASTL